MEFVRVRGIEEHQTDASGVHDVAFDLKELVGRVFLLDLSRRSVEVVEGASEVINNPDTLLGS